MGMTRLAVVLAVGAALLCALLAAVYPSVYPKLHKKHFRKLDRLTDRARFRQVFLPGILKPRVSGTSGNFEVREFLKSQLSVLNDWTVEQDTFNDSTPLGIRNFANIVATLDPNATKRVVLAAHYDSKHMLNPNDEFVGATDSAVPCAMLLDIAYSLQTLFRQRQTNLDTTLQLIFFDGEEAFVSWTDDDSLYGARHLAARWETTAHPVATNLTLLTAIDVFILLDLVGAPNPTFYNQYSNTSKVFDRLRVLEQRLAKKKLLRDHQYTKHPYFKSGLLSRPLGIADDHLPFIRRGQWDVVGSNKHNIIDYYNYIVLGRRFSGRHR
ncbi:glutaminyl-peptide cyclotransferase-like protein isoform X2 [Corticium candelabrum]|uniref:glutaminyl-peptide cyclotransferase-like protein isoform X2 n=1 Tax=Corticium candelabrum TaxID=121492 RepID=UPI002E260ACF|nr:glutaminyl-peptide cyclotransferase-like protein isoform X2 [Corticium candelabrum]